MKGSSRALLDLEGNSSFSSSLESKLLVCKNDGLLRSQIATSNQPAEKPSFSSVPKSEIFGKVKDFLGVISEANKKLLIDSKENPKDYDIEALTGSESKFIEMDLMLGIADLHTPEAVSAAESAIAGCQPVIPLADSVTDCEDSSDDSEDSCSSDDGDCNGVDINNCSLKSKGSFHKKADSSSKELRKLHPKKRPKIVELP